MNRRAVIYVVSALSIVIGVSILTSSPVAWLMGDDTRTISLLAISAVIPMVFGGIGILLTRSKAVNLGVREGFGIVTFGWLVASIFGAIPFMLISDLSWYDAFFETMSGFTTTGASVLDSNLVLASGEKLVDGIPQLPDGLLYWRSMTHWLGGMGIVVLSLAIIPFLGIGGQSLYNAEVPGPTSDQLTPRIASSAKILWAVYVLLTIVETGLLWAGGMPLFDSWCHTCGTMATGGFSTKQASIGHYDSAYFDGVITLFMFLAGCNFVLHYKALRGKPLFYFKDEEWRFYTMVTVAATLTIAAGLMAKNDSIILTTGKEVAPTLWNALRFSSFQVASILTTTGYATADFDLWIPYAQLVLVLLMFTGGCGGSTGGGMKNSRVVLLLKYGQTQLKRCLFPNALSNVRLSNARISNTTVHKTLGFFFLFVTLFVVFTFIISITEAGNPNCRPAAAALEGQTLSMECDIVTAATSSIACLANIGPGLGRVGPTSSYSWMSPLGKIVLTFAMLLGRLELYTVLVIFLPSFWKK
ncbi:hypothetical protein BVY04_02535 [bacterium M21]|nr:hypothetical protein BVY04_02535 [bacterium M21]